MFDLIVNRETLLNLYKKVNDPEVVIIEEFEQMKPYMSLYFIKETLYKNVISATPDEIIPNVVKNELTLMLQKKLSQIEKNGSRFQTTIAKECLTILKIYLCVAFSVKSLKEAILKAIGYDGKGRFEIHYAVFLTLYFIYLIKTDAV